MNKDQTESGKIVSVVAYLTLIGSVIAIIMNLEKKNPFSAFHARQGLGLCLSYMLIGYFLFIANLQSDMIYIPFWICFGVFFLYGIVGAITGKTNQVPIVGALYQKLFSNIGK